MDDTSKTGSPSYPGTASQPDPDDGLAELGPGWKTVLVIVIVVLRAAVFILLHVTGVAGAKTNM